MAEPINFLFGLWTPVGRRKHKFNGIRKVAPICPHWRAHWHNLANTTEPSVCSSNVALRQIILTTCYYSLYICRPLAKFTMLGRSFLVMLSGHWRQRLRRKGRNVPPLRSGSSRQGRRPMDDFPWLMF